LKLLVDVGVGKIVETLLRADGHDVLAIRDIDARLSDLEILKLAVKERRLILTMDKDFGELVHWSKEDHAGVLLLRLEEATGDEKVAVIRRVFQVYGQKVLGNFSVFRQGRLRIRRRD